jgi:protein involved in polysaccharide export with SLBB domain
MTRLTIATALILCASLALGQTTTSSTSTPPGAAARPIMQLSPDVGNAVFPPSVQPIPALQVPAPAAPVAAQAPTPGAQPFDYSFNLNSSVFGAQLFTGSFAGSSAALFNPDYVISVGDQLQVRLWGAVDFEMLLTVDPKGNIFVPRVGPIRVAGVRNSGLQKVLEQSLRRVFQANVYSYISLATAQPVRVFVTGSVQRPGMYPGVSTDSVLRYLDQAGGIDVDRGSFLDVQVKRGSQTRATINLYEFLLDGTLPVVQLGDGDVIFVQPRRSTFMVAGFADNTKRFEFTGESIPMSRLIAMAKPQPQATHVRVTRNSGIVRNTEYYALSDAAIVPLSNGDDIEFTADKRPGTITVRVEGEHLSQQEFVLPYGARIGELVKRVQLTERSDSQNLQLYRLSVNDRQKALLNTALNSLQNTVLTVRSGTGEEAALRKVEAEMVLQWIDRARKVEPLGQVLIAQSKGRNELLLENGDVIRVPVKDGLVLVSGEVLFPNAVAFDGDYGLQDYVKRAGGYTQTADTARIVIAHRDGSFEDGLAASVRAGDEILVLPRADTKSRQFWKDVTQILYQIAISTKVILGL